MNNWDRHFRRIIQKTPAMIRMKTVCGESSQKGAAVNNLSPLKCSTMPEGISHLGTEGNGSCGCSPSKGRLILRLHSGSDPLPSATE